MEIVTPAALTVDHVRWTVVGSCVVPQLAVAGAVNVTIAWPVGGRGGAAAPPGADAPCWLGDGVRIVVDTGAAVGSPVFAGDRGVPGSRKMRQPNSRAPNRNTMPRMPIRTAQPRFIGAIIDTAPAQTPWEMCPDYDTKPWTC